MKLNNKIVFGSMLVVFASTSILGCGGAKANQGGSSLQGDDGAVPEDPKVVEARKRCDEEIKRAEIQPPDQLKEIQIRACIYAAKQEVEKCQKAGKRDLVLKIMVDKSGQITNAFPIGDTADCPEAQCVAEAVQKIKLPRFKGKPQQVIKYPFTLGE